MSTEMDRLQKFQEYMRRRALSQAYADSAAEITAELETEAREELSRTRTRPSWSAPDVADVVLPLSKATVSVSSIEALKGWVETNHPEQIRTVKEVHASYQKWLAENAEINADGEVLHPDTKQPIPGLTYRPGGVPQSLRFTADKTAAALYANYAAQEVAVQVAEFLGASEDESPADASGSPAVPVEAVQP